MLTVAVTDKCSGRRINADVTIVDDRGKKAEYSVPTGSLEKKVEPGVYRITASKKDYDPKSKSVAVRTVPVPVS